MRCEKSGRIRSQNDEEGKIVSFKYAVHDDVNGMYDLGVWSNASADR